MPNQCQGTANLQIKIAVHVLAEFSQAKTPTPQNSPKHRLGLFLMETTPGFSLFLKTQTPQPLQVFSNHGIKIPFGKKAPWNIAFNPVATLDLKLCYGPLVLKVFRPFDGASLQPQFPVSPDIDQEVGTHDL
jgi:hypothetical protein